MELSRIVISDLQDQQMIVLHEVDGDRQFPIVIGDPEAKAIDRRLKGILHSRPMTHDLLADVVEKMGGTVDRIEIHNLEDHTFFAHVVIRRPTKRDDGHLDTEWLELDSRPSDAIAVGHRDERADLRRRARSRRSRLTWMLQQVAATQRVAGRVWENDDRTATR